MFLVLSELSSLPYLVIPRPLNQDILHTSQGIVNHVQDIPQSMDNQIDGTLNTH